MADFGGSGISDDSLGDFDDAATAPPAPPAPKAKLPSSPETGPDEGLEPEGRMPGEDDYRNDPQATRREVDTLRAEARRNAAQPASGEATIGEGRVPPHDLDSEAAVLSVIFARGGEALDDIEGLLSAEDMYSEAHRRMFEAAHELHSAGQPVDILQIHTWLKDRDRVKQIGGAGYLTEVADSAPHIDTKYLKAYAKRVRNRARMRRLILTLQRATAQALVGVPDREMEGFFEGVEKNVQDICAERHVGGLRHINDAIGDMRAKMKLAMASDTGQIGISTGFVDLDHQMGGLFEGDLSLVGARPGMGKTSYVLALAENVAKRGYGTAIFSLEMPEDQLAQRMCAASGSVDMLKVRRCSLDNDEWNKFTDAGKFLRVLEVYVDATPGISILELAAKVRRLKADLARKGIKLGLVIIDYLQLMKVRNPDRMAQSIGEISTGLKNLAKEVEVPIVALAQLNRAVEGRSDRRPVMSDLRESGNLEQDADNIVLLYRDEYYDPETEDKGIVEGIIAKQRNGPTGVVKLGFEKHSTKFFNLERGTPPEGYAS